MEKNFHEKDKKFYTGGADKKYVPTPVYPNVHFTFNELEDHPTSSPGEIVYVWEMRTLLRKKHKGIWYGIKVLDTGVVPAHNKKMAQLYISHAMSRFQTNIYLAQQFTRIDPNLCDTYGDPVFRPLSDQRDEEERLKEVFRLPF